MSQSEIDLLRNKHTELIDIVTKRVQTDFPEDIDLIGICGSFLTDDFYEKSDLDLLVVPNNERVGDLPLVLFWMVLVMIFMAHLGKNLKRWPAMTTCSYHMLLMWISFTAEILNVWNVFNSYGAKHSASSTVR